MLAHLQQHVTTVLASSHQVTLATSGPAGLQAPAVRCIADGLRLLLLVPRTSDSLVNLEAGDTVVVSNARWQAHGKARVLDVAERMAAPLLRGLADTAWCEVVEVRPTRVMIAHKEGWGAAETIDLDLPKNAR
jgi:hypothetical protein